MSLSGSSYYGTTDTEDEDVESHLRKNINLEEEEKQNTNEQLEEQYEEYFIDNINKPDSIFNWPGMYFIDFTNKKIKFSFTPCEVITLVNRRVKFYCSIKYRNNRWTIMRNSIPVNHRSVIYAWYYRPIHENDRISSLEDILGVIHFIYRELIAWCGKEELFRNEKKTRYLAGKHVELDSDDEELFVKPEDVEEHRRKREAILKRMIPPPESHHRDKRLRLRI